MRRLARITLWELSLPLAAPVSWTVGGSGQEVPCLVALFEDGDGRRGASEILCRPEWNGVTPGLLARAVSDMARPRLHDADGEDADAALTALAPIRGAMALTALCDNAWRDMVAPAPAPLAPVRVADLLTRAPAGAMAEAALAARDGFGITAFKVKLGQGLSTDAQVLHGLRDALGDGAEISGDANGAYGLGDLPELLALAADTGLSFLEDPVPLAPDAALDAALRGAAVPVLADKAVTGTELLTAFRERGITQVSAKPTRLGRGIAGRIAAQVHGAGGRICNGTYSESALGAAGQIAFAQGLPPGLAHQHEIAFHRGLAAQIAELPVIADGLAAPICGRLADRLDMTALTRLARARHDLGPARTAARKIPHS